MILRAKRPVKILWIVSETGEVKVKIQALMLPKTVEHPHVQRLSRIARKDPKKQQPAPNSELTSGHFSSSLWSIGCLYGGCC